MFLTAGRLQVPKVFTSLEIKPSLYIYHPVKKNWTFRIPETNKKYEIHVNMHNVLSISIKIKPLIFSILVL